MASWSLLVVRFRMKFSDNPKYRKVNIPSSAQTRQAQLWAAKRAEQYVHTTSSSSPTITRALVATLL